MSKHDVSLRKISIATDLCQCAKQRNMILTAERYESCGKYSLKDVNAYFGSFDNACIELHIINPNNLDDYEGIVRNIRYVFCLRNKISREIYAENGAYDIKDLDKKYGFDRILLNEKMISKLPKITIVYPKYKIKTRPLPIIMKVTHTYAKHFSGE